MNIYEIPWRYQEMVSLLDQEGDEGLEEAVANALDQIKNDLKAQAESLGKLLSNMSASNAAIKNEIDRLKGLLDDRSRRYDLLKNAIKKAMIETNQRKITTDLYTFSIRKGRPLVVVKDESKLPDEYIKIEVESSPVKAEIKKGIDAGLISSDIAYLETSDESLSIK